VNVGSGFSTPGGVSVSTGVTTVDTRDEKRRAAAKCDRCGTIGIVRVCADGALRPLGQSTICDCNGETLRVLETDPDDGEEV
jgi:hypothetical protein